MNISVTIQVMDLKFSMGILKLLEGSVSQIFDIGPSSYFMSKKGNFLSFLQNKFLHFMK